MKPKHVENQNISELRQQAEAKMYELQKKKPESPSTEVDALHLMHELEVHQIELEMQNEELKQSHL